MKQTEQTVRLREDIEMKVREAAFALVSAAEQGKVDGYRKRVAIDFLRAITAEFGDMAAPHWKERADKLEGGK
jgi:hypothetical protein